MSFLSYALDAVFCTIIAYYAFEINRRGSITRLGKIAVYGVKTIMISAAIVPLMTVIGTVLPMYLGVATIVSKVGINAGLVVTLLGHTAMIKAKENENVA